MILLQLLYLLHERRNQTVKILIFLELLQFPLTLLVALLQLTIPLLQALVLLLDLPTKHKPLPIKGDQSIQIPDLLASDLLLLQKQHLLLVELIIVTTDVVQTRLQIIEFDGQLLVLVGHPRDLPIHHLVFLLHLIDLLIRTLVFTLPALQLNHPFLTFSTSNAIYFS